MEEIGGTALKESNRKKYRIIGTIIIPVLIYLVILAALMIKDNITHSMVLSPKQQSPSGYWGYTDEEGNIIIEHKYKSAEPFVNGHAVVIGQSYKGVINSKGEYIIEPRYSGIENLGDEYVICIDKDNKYYIIDTKDTEKVYGPFMEVSIDKHNICIVKSYDTDYYGLFVDSSLKYECIYNSITLIDEGEYQLQQGTAITTYAYKTK